MSANSAINPYQIPLDNTIASLSLASNPAERLSNFTDCIREIKGVVSEITIKPVPPLISPN